MKKEFNKIVLMSLIFMATSIFSFSQNRIGSTMERTVVGNSWGFLFERGLGERFNLQFNYQQLIGSKHIDNYSNIGLLAYYDMLGLKKTDFKFNVGAKVISSNSGMLSMAPQIEIRKKIGGQFDLGTYVTQRYGYPAYGFRLYLGLPLK